MNLEIQNRCLLSKWLFKLLNSKGMLQTILKRKYLRAKTLSQVEHVIGDSQFSASLMLV